MADRKQRKLKSMCLKKIIKPKTNLNHNISIIFRVLTNQWHGFKRIAWPSFWLSVYVDNISATYSFQLTTGKWKISTYHFGITSPYNQQQSRRVFLGGETDVWSIFLHFSFRISASGFANIKRVSTSESTILVVSPDKQVHEIPRCSTCFMWHSIRAFSGQITITITLFG